MARFPLFIELNKMYCLVVGGGCVAARKAKVLAQFGATVEVISKSFCDSFNSEEYKRIPNCKLIEEEISIASFDQKDWKKYSIIIASTDDKELNHAISVWCQDHGIYINSATSKEDSNFIFPAVVRKEGITVGVTSEGKSPAVTRLIRTRVEECIPDCLEKRLEELEQARELVKSKVREQSLRKKIFYDLVQIGINEQKEITEAVVTEVISKVMREYEDND